MKIFRRNVTIHKNDQIVIHAVNASIPPNNRYADIYVCEYIADIEV